MLPNLHTLIVFIDFNWVSDSSWETLLRALSARRIQLQKVHVYVSRYPHVVIPEAEILAAFRELAADGIDVYVGTKRATGYESQNFILED
jgi:phosphatidylserine/phosphatidylglycerophosphate/cardiolipin synthase-like enzyme